MTDAPVRTRRRRRPATTDETTEARNGGQTISERQTTKHKRTDTQTLSTIDGVVMARVMVRDGVTLNMLDYNSFRRDIGLELDVELGTTDEVYEADDQLTEAAEDRLNNVVDTMGGWIENKLKDVVNDADDFFGG